MLIGDGQRKVSRTRNGLRRRLRHLASVVGAVALLSGFGSVVMATSASGAAPATWYVTAGGTGDCSSPTNACGTITQALEAAANANDVGDTIDVSGTISDGDIEITSSVGTPSAPVTITGAQASAGNPAVVNGSVEGGDSVFIIDANAGLVLDDIEITGGAGSSGGGIDNAGTLTTDDATITGNCGAGNGTGRGGCGIDNEATGQLTLTDSVVSDNSGPYDAGGIYNDGNAVINGSTVTGNSSNEGSSAAGIYNDTAGEMVITDSTISDNMSAEATGGIESWSTLTVTDSTISDNGNTLGLGEPAGGILAQNSTATITNSTLVDNVGAAIVTNNATLGVTSSTISGNHTITPAEGLAGPAGIATHGTGSATVGATLLTDNLEGNAREATDCGFNGVTDAGYNVADDGTCGFSGTSQNHATVPLAALASNGGPTQTMLPTSAAADIIPPSPAVVINDVDVCPGTDQRGVARPSTENGDCTVGAVEDAAPVAPTITSAASAGVSASTPASVTITATGLPTPALTESGTLPDGVTFVDNGDGTATLSGTPESLGPYALVISADNGVAPAATQDFTLTVSPASSSAPPSGPPASTGSSVPSPPSAPSGATRSQGASSSTSTGTAAATLSGDTPAGPPDISAAGTGIGALTVAQYAANPTDGSVPSGTGTYDDLDVAPGSSFSNVVLTVCALGPGGRSLTWWNGTAWLAFSDQSFSASTGCVTAMVTASTSPNFADLEGTPVAASSDAICASRAGYWEVARDGGVFTFGDAGFYGSMGGAPLNAPVVGLTSTPDGQGYWEVARDGGVFAFGDAEFYGSMGGTPLNEPVVALASTPDGRGYWEVASDGGVFAFGDASFYGSMGGKPLNKPVVALTSTPDGRGYWEVASDGGVFAFGDASFYGSTGGAPSNAPVVDVTSTPDGRGYWEVAGDGGVSTFGDAGLYGSRGGAPLNKPVVALASTSDGKGYWEVASDGGIFAFGDAGFYGSMGGTPLNAPVVGIAAVGSWR